MGRSRCWSCETSGHIYVVQPAFAPDKALDVTNESKANGANAISWQFKRGNNQLWVVKVDGKGNATFKCVMSGKYLNVAGAKTKSGANVEQRASSSSNSLKWKITKNKNGTYRIASALSSKLSLAVHKASKKDGANVKIATNNSSAAQQWKFYDVTKMRKQVSAKAKKNKGIIKAGK